MIESRRVQGSDSCKERYNNKKDQISGYTKRKPEKKYWNNVN